MLSKIAGAFLGNKLAGRNEGFKGAMMGAAGAHFARRGVGGLGTALLLGYGAKKLMDYNRSRRSNPSYPTSATPGRQGGRTHSI